MLKAKSVFYEPHKSVRSVFLGPKFRIKGVVVMWSKLDTLLDQEIVLKDLEKWQMEDPELSIVYLGR